MLGDTAPLVADALGDLREDYLAAVLRPDARRARELIAAAVEAGAPVESLYLKVLQPALEEVGLRWERAEISVAREHLATQISQAVLAELAGRLSPGGGGEGRKAIVSCSPGEMHAIGGQMVADFLEADAWNVLTLGADVPASELARLAAEERVAVVALSTALPEHLLAAGAACSALRRLPDPPLIVAGGRAFRGDEALAVTVGADAYAHDPADLLRVLAERVPV
jgi:MerR family transcriptional regulator, light-induced transcriptional regulator